MKIKLEDIECECSVVEFMQLKEMIGLKNMIKKELGDFLEKRKNTNTLKSESETKKRVRVYKKKPYVKREKANRKENALRYQHAIKLFKKGGITRAAALRKAGLPVDGSYYTVFAKKLKESN